VAIPNPDTTAIDQAVIDLLQRDPTLAALAPDGVYMDEAPPNAQRFVIVALADAEDVPVFGGRAYEHKQYTVVAKMLNTAGGDIRSAAAQIDYLLEDVVLVAAGYACMAVYRERPIRETDVDDTDPSLRWFHRGGLYHVEMVIDDGTTSQKERR